MSKKINIMSLSVDLDFQERVKKIAKKRNISTSKLVRDIVEKHLGTDDDEINPIDTVILKIPAQAKINAEELTKWLRAREQAIIKTLVV